MLASKNRATNSFLKSEKKSLYRFLSLYMALVMVLMTLLSIFYYQNQEKLILAEKRALLTKYAYIQVKRLKVLHHFFDARKEYPRDPRFKSAIYDMEYTQIFSLLEESDIHFDKEIYFTPNHIHLVKMLDAFYLGTKYLIIEVADDGKWKAQIKKEIITYGTLVLLFFILFGFYLAKLFLQPMRESILLLDRFIKDTTHELNTPLLAIVANIEMMDTKVMTPKNIKKLNRINIAAKMVSTLYKDLTYLTLEQEKENEDEVIDVKALIYDRVEYFSVLMDSKHVTTSLALEEATIVMDRRKLTRVIDNLISNAIKYNQREGRLGIKLSQGVLSIWDSGIGLDAKNIAYMFDRYSRFNHTQGGFGVGLSIVKAITDEYGIVIKVKSEKAKGTEVRLTW